MKALEMICEDGETILVEIDEEQTVVITELLGESITGRIVLLEIEAMGLANFLFEEMVIHADT